MTGPSLHDVAEYHANNVECLLSLIRCALTLNDLGRPDLAVGHLRAGYEVIRREDGDLYDGRDEPAEARAHRILAASRGPDRWVGVTVGHHRDSNIEGTVFVEPRGCCVNCRSEVSIMSTGTPRRHKRGDGAWCLVLRGARP